MWYNKPGRDLDRAVTHYPPDAMRHTTSGHGKGTPVNVASSWTHIKIYRSTSLEASQIPGRAHVRRTATTFLHAPKECSPRRQERRQLIIRLRRVETSHSNPHPKALQRAPATPCQRRKKIKKRDLIMKRGWHTRGLRGHRVRDCHWPRLHPLLRSRAGIAVTLRARRPLLNLSNRPLTPTAYW